MTQGWLSVCQVCSNDDPRLTFVLFTARSNLHPHAFVWRKCWKVIFSKYIKDKWLKLQGVIKVVKHFSHNQNFVPWGLSALAPGLYICNKIVYFLNVFFSENCLSSFHQISHGLLSKGYCQFVQMVPRHWTRWPPCPFMVKTLKNLLLQNQESFGAESWILVYSIAVSSSTKFVQMMMIFWPLTFLWHCQICISIDLSGLEGVGAGRGWGLKMTNARNLQCMSKVVKVCSKDQDSAPHPSHTHTHTHAPPPRDYLT